jgi:hypothetical protein
MSIKLTRPAPPRRGRRRRPGARTGRSGAAFGLWNPTARARRGQIWERRRLEAAPTELGGRTSGTARRSASRASEYARRMTGRPLFWSAALSHCRQLGPNAPSDDPARRKSRLGSRRASISFGVRAFHPAGGARLGRDGRIGARTRGTSLSSAATFELGAQPERRRKIAPTHSLDD